MSSSSGRTELERLVAALRTDVFAQADDMSLSEMNMAYDLSAGGGGAAAGGGGLAGVDQLTSAERMAAYSVGVATPSRSIAALSKTEKSVERLYNSMRTTEAGIDDAMKFSSEVHKRALQQKDTELNQLKQLLVAKERTIDSLRDTVESAKRTLEAKLTAITNELAARDGELHEERRRTQDLAYRCQQAELLAQTAVDAAKRNEEAREAELKERKKEQDRIYREHLSALMVKGQLDESERDRLIEAQQAKYEAKRQEEKDREERARANLMAEVYADRERQLAAKAARRVAAAEDKADERRRMEEEMAEMRVAEEDHGAQVNAVRVQNRLDIEAQIQYRDSMAAKKKEEQRRQWESSMRAEADYQRMIENDQRRVNPATPSYARKSAAWFD